MVANKTLIMVWVVTEVVGSLGLTQFAGNGRLMAMLHRSVPYSSLVATHTGIVAQLKASKIGSMCFVADLDSLVIKSVMNSRLLQPRSGVYNDRDPWFEVRTASEAAKTYSTPCSMNMDLCSGRIRRMVTPSKSSGGFGSGSFPQMKVKVGNTLVLYAHASILTYLRRDRLYRRLLYF